MEQNQPPQSPASPTSAPVEAPVSNTIVYDDFAKVQFRVGTVVEATAIEKSKKLLKLQVDLGTEKRQILAGIKEHYTPEQMIGRQIVVVVNLAPREVMKGEISNGMLLAASDPVTGKVVVIAPSDVVAPGSGVR